jgi:hypothetical protein
MPTDDEAQRIMDTDQVLAAVADQARMVAEYYGVLAASMPPAAALALTLQFQGSLLWTDGDEEEL